MGDWDPSLSVVRYDRVAVQVIILNGQDAQTASELGGGGDQNGSGNTEGWAPSGAVSRDGMPPPGGSAENRGRVRGFPFVVLFKIERASPPLTAFVTRKVKGR